MDRFRRLRHEHGFTLIELMVIVMIIGILITLALPAFLGARKRAQDRGAESDIRNTYTAERVYFAGGNVYTDDPVALSAVEPSLTYAGSNTPGGNGTVNLFHVMPADLIYISERSASGTCFYLKDDNGTLIGYATSATCSDASAQTYGPASLW